MRSGLSKNPFSMPPKQSLRTLLPALCGGLLLGLAYPPTGFAFGLLAFVALVPFLVSLESTERLRHAFKRAYYGTFIWNLIVTYWVGGWFADGNVDPFLMVSGIALTFFQPLLLSIPFLLYDVIRRKYGIPSALIMLPVIWVGFEYWRSTTDIAFPWLSLHNTQTYNLAYIQFIEFTGSYGISLLLVCINVAVYILYRKGRIIAEGVTGRGLALFLSKHIIKIVISVLSVCIVLPYLYGALKLNASQEHKPDLHVLIVQPNINPWAKWELSSARIVDSMIRSTYSGLQKHGSVDMVLWPETAITYPITVPSMREDLNGLNMFISSINASLLTGIPDKEYYVKGKDVIPQDAKDAGGGEFYRAWNAAMLFYQDASRSIRYQRYHKQLLVPFGERVPFVDDFPFLGELFKWGVGLGSWNREGVDSLLMLSFHGSSITAPQTANIAMLICYESVFPTYVQQAVQKGANLISIVTNDGWYGNSSGPYQHERYAILRAIENRRWVIRSANTGISCVIDETGHIVDELPFNASGSIRGEIPLLSSATFYSSIGDVIPRAMMWANGALVTFFAVSMFLRKRKKVSSGAA